MTSKLFLVLVSMIAAFIVQRAMVSFAASSGGNIERITKYRGPSIEVSEPLLCKSNEWAAGGFWRNPRSVDIEKGARVATEPDTTTWRITIKGETAEVIRFSGAMQTLEKPEVFSVELTTGGLLLISKSRPHGVSPQIITIDLSNASFVYSTQHVNPLWNRASVFYGVCNPYP